MYINILRSRLESRIKSMQWGGRPELGERKLMADRLKVVVPAAGTGSRMGGATNKQFVLLGNKPVLSYCLDFFTSRSEVESIVVVCRADEVEYCRRQVIRRGGYDGVVSVVAGGKERQDSVYNGLMSLAADTGLVAVHDGARPLLEEATFERVWQAARRWGAAIPGILPKDTLKTIDGESFVGQTLDRSSIVAVQTPQIFSLQGLLQAYRKAQAENYYGTDDASLYERYIGKVKVVAGDYRNLKITTPEDLALAEIFLHSQAGSRD
jgi:2-C-methyl-D-erythritol 4-phosphate cytidylyltransferase